MSQAKFSRKKKQQLGQFFTPPRIAQDIVSSVDLIPNMRILEPSFGKGVFIDALYQRVYEEKIPCKIWGCEIDEALYKDYSDSIKATRRNGTVRLFLGDFFQWMPNQNGHDYLRHGFYFGRNWEYFDLIIGNPPFGGSIDGSIQDALDQIYGWRGEQKIKKETYSLRGHIFFIGRIFRLAKEKRFTLNGQR